MAYFSNSTEGMDYVARYCDKCVHRNGLDGNSGCAVWLLHLLYAYDECNGTGNAKNMLDGLIPMVEGGHVYKMAGQCTMFYAGEPMPKSKPESTLPVTVIPSMEAWAKKHGVL